MLCTFPMLKSFFNGKPLRKTWLLSKSRALLRALDITEDVFGAESMQQIIRALPRPIQPQGQPAVPEIGGLDLRIPDDFWDLRSPVMRACGGRV
jgi:hypothetical protein